MSITLSHIARLRKSNSVAVRVVRGAQTCELIAVPAVSKANMVGADGSYTTIEVADWIIVAADWTLTNPATPQKGDKIVVVADGTEYRVAHPDEKTPVFSNFNQLDRPALAWTVHSM